MNTQFNELVRDLRGLPQHAISFTVNWWLKKRWPEFAILETSDSDFSLDSFAAYGHCELAQSADMFSEINTGWNSDAGIQYDQVENGLFDVVWNGHKITILRLTWKEDYCAREVSWMIGDTQPALNDFFAAVCQWEPPTDITVEVFQDGRWSRSQTLHHAIQSATLDNLILAPGLKEEIQLDLAHFFESRAMYDRYGIPWKRGILLAGPPGNGKTHTVKALINWLDKPALYVRSITSRHYTEHQMMNMVFSRARAVTPSILVFEDLESIVTALNRSYFLNELDGFALNTGILVLATTNHPELLDPALTERPSRFDRKYNFDLPAERERALYLSGWNQKIEDHLKLTDEGIDVVAAATGGFSFAFLKELIMASMMRWINQPEQPSMDEVMTAQTKVLRTQMSSASTSIPELLIDDGVTSEDEE